MKRILVFIIALFALAACKQESKIKIIQNEEADYHRAFEVNRLPAFADSTHLKDLDKDMIELVKEYIPAKGGESVMIPIYYEVFISEKGKVEKIKNTVKKTVVDEYNVEKAVFGDKDKMDAGFAKLAEKWSFSPALKSGNPVKFIVDFRGSVIKMKDGITIFGYKGKSYLFRNQSGIHLSNSKWKNNIVNDLDYFVAVEKMPEPIGGLKAIANKVRYPEIAKRAGVQGRVFVKAFIDEKGNVVGTRIIKGLGAGCDQAAMEAVMQARFTPGRQRGKAVKVQVSIPILFKLN